MSGLELVRPWALWGFLLGIPIVLLHLYARRRQRVIMPFVGLLREALGPARPTSRFKHLREALSLLLRLTALACLVLALGGLRPAVAARPPVDLMLVVDADVTTRALERDRLPRLVHGLRLAAAHARHHAAGRVGAVLAGEPLQVLAPLDEDPEAVAKRLLDLAARVAGRPRLAGEAALRVPARTATDLDAAVEAAAAAAGRRGVGRVVVISARPLAPVPASARAVLGVERSVVGAGSARANQGIDDLGIRLDAEQGYAVRVHLRSDAAASQTRTVTARVGASPETATPVFEQSVAVATEAGAELSFEVAAPPAPGAWLFVQLSGRDAFDVDDAVEAWLAPQHKPSVLVVKGKRARGFTALVLDQLGDALDLEHSGFVDPAHLAEANPRDVVVVDGVALPPGALRPGAYVFLAPLAGALPFEIGPPIAAPLVWRTERDHPLVRWLDFSAAQIQAGTSITGPGVRPLAYADGRVVVAEGERDGVRYVVFGLDPTGSYLSVQTALPLFLRRAILRLAAAPIIPLKPFYRVGEDVRPRSALPGGPNARIRRLRAGREAAGGEVGPVRIDPLGGTWRVPAGWRGPVEIETTDAKPAWVGRTAVVDFAPGRTIVPVRPPGKAPAPRPRARPPGAAWRGWLILAALVLLGLDLFVLPRSRPASRT